MALALYEHNQKAYRAVVAMMKETGRAAVIHPTGTGKSFLAFQLAEDNPQARIVWLSPSRYIFDQQLANLRQTAPDFSAGNITFLTYAALMANRDRACMLQPDYVILDEFHRCGAVEWKKGVEALLAASPQAKVLGLSATCIRYLDGRRDMAKELFDGRIACEMTLGEAIARGILASPRYVISVYRYEEELRKYEEKVQRISQSGRRSQAKQRLDRLRRALARADGLPAIFGRYLKPDGKYIMFCAGVSHIEEMLKHAEEWFAPVDTAYRLYRVFTGNSENAGEFQRFLKDHSPHLKLLLCIDMLNEGIHLPDIDGVILLRATASPVIYRQQIGRALTAGKKKAEQDGERPLILDLVNNFENLNSIRSVGEEYQEAAGRLCLMRDQEADRPGGFEIVDETREAGKLFAALQEKLEADWEAYYREARAYFQVRGDLEVPAGYVSPAGLSLGSWVQTQRRIYTGKIPGHLSEEQTKRLEELGMRWESFSDRQWEHYYEQAAQYYAENGHLHVRPDYVTKEGFRLGVWLNNLRQYRRNQSRLLSGERQRQLEQIGMIWDRLRYKWERGCEEAKKYAAAHGNLDVPAGYVSEDGFSLGNWIAAQRQNYRGESRGALPLTPEQVSRLESLGIDWEGKQVSRWEKGYEAAKRYRERYGNLEVPGNYVSEDGFRLGQWLYSQRASLREEGSCFEEKTGFREKESEPESRSKRRGTIREEERRARLGELGMVWDKDAWQEKWEQARAYYEAHGNLDVPQNYVTGEGVWLGKWLYLQRSRYRRGGPAVKKAALTARQIQALESIGMVWQTPAEQAWESAYEKARAYYEKNGRLPVEQGETAEDGFRLDLWLKRQRKCRREGKTKVLSPERIKRLDEMGMDWRTEE